MKRLMKTRLSTMMFFEYFIWGAWYVTVAVFMKHHGMKDLTHWPFTVNPIAALVAPFFVGLIADRYFSTENVFGVLHLIGGGLMFLAPQFAGRPVLFILILLAYNLCYMPTINLSNSISFHNIGDQEKDFPVIRVFGTVGWIVAGLVISFGLVYFVGPHLKVEKTALPLYLAAGSSVLLGLYGFTLPHTPPPAKGEEVSLRSIIGLDALQKLGSRSFYVFLVCSVLITIPLAAYYNFTQIFLGDTGFSKIAGTQSIGQMSEVVFMILMPFFFIRLGVKWMLAAGMAAWVARYGLFALGAPDQVASMIVAGIALHGICYDFFFVAGQIYVDKKASDEIKGQAQGLIVLLTYGLGMLVGAQLAGRLYNYFLGSQSTLTPDQWQQFWMIPAIFAAVVLLFFILTFRDRVIEDEDDVEAEEFSV